MQRRLVILTNETEAVIQTYFDASYEGSKEKMLQVFHPAAHIYGHRPDGTLSVTPRNAFAERVGTPRPDRPSYPRQDQILSIDFTGEHAAVARVSLRVGNTLYTDVLTFLRFDGEWSIIAKAYSGVAAV